MVHLKNVFEGDKESAGFLQTGQATFSLFHINEIRLGFKIFTQQSLNHALIFFIAVNDNYYFVGFFQVAIHFDSLLAIWFLFCSTLFSYNQS